MIEAGLVEVRSADLDVDEVTPRAASHDREMGGVQLHEAYLPLCQTSVTLPLCDPAYCAGAHNHRGLP